MAQLARDRKFWDACDSGDLKALQAMTGNSNNDGSINGINVNLVRGKFESTPLIRACLNGHAHVVQFLLRLPGVNVNLPQNEGTSPFYAACQEGHRRIIELLLADPRVDPNQAKEDGATAFFDKCCAGEPDLVTLLLSDPRINVNLALVDGTTPLFIACQNAHLEVVKVLLKSGARLQVNQARNDGATPFYIACQLGHKEIVMALLQEPSIQVNKSQNFSATPICMAALGGKQLVVQLLLGSGRFVDVHTRTVPGPNQWNGKTPAEQAAWKGHETISELIEAFAMDNMKVLREIREEMQEPEHWIETILGIPLSTCVKSSVFQGKEAKEVSRLVLADSQIHELPLELGEFSNLIELDLSSNPLSPASALVITSLIKSSSSLTSIDLSNTTLGAEGLSVIIQALVVNFNRGQFTLQKLEVDDVALKNFDGLQIIPRDILEKGTSTIVRYMLDLYSAPEAEPLYRTKLMVVGYENVGKSTLLDCLFPMTGWMQSKGQVRKNRYWFKLQGSRLTKYDHQDDELPHKNRELVIKDREWEVIPTNANEITLSKKVKSKEAPDVRLFCPDEETRNTWLTRLKRICMNEATHGIEIQDRVVDHEVSREFFKDRQGRLELSVWDFAGQHNYYNNHHHFLTGRSVFLILWKLSDGDQGLKGLEFWLTSLSARLTKYSSQFYQSGEAQEGHRAFSIIVVGTFLDHPSVDRDRYDERRAKIEEIARQVGVHDPLNYMEVSCATLENVSTLEGAIYSLCLSHSNMGERVPMTYISVEKTIGELLQQQGQDQVPVIDLKELVSPARSEDVVKRALSLLSLWGKCVYFEEPPELASVVVLNPRFLTKEVLGQLFKPEMVGQFAGGVIRHENLAHVWTDFKARSDFWELASMLIKLMEKFEVCFPLRPPPAGNPDSPFQERRSIIPTLLPEEEPTDLRTTWWPATTTGGVHQEEVFSFNIVPKELVGRLFVRLHRKAKEHCIWRTGLCFDSEYPGVRGLVTVSLENNSIQVAVRGMEGGCGGGGGEEEEGPSLRERCDALTESLTKFVLDTSALYPGVMLRREGEPNGDVY